MDRYTKNVLTIIAVGIIGINIQMLGDKIITPAHATNHIQKVQICDGRVMDDCAAVIGHRIAVRDFKDNDGF